MDRQLVQPHGLVEFRKYEADGQEMVLISMPHSGMTEVLDLEFRVADFVAFVDYAAAVASNLVDGLTDG